MKYKLLCFFLLLFAAGTISAQCIITEHPKNKSMPGKYGLVYFMVTATGTGPTFQWQENTGSGWINISNGVYYTIASGAISNSPNSFYSWLNVFYGYPFPKNHNGYQYRCIVSGSCGQVISNTAMLTYQPNFITSQPSNVAACTGDTATISIGTDTSQSPLIYNWYVITPTQTLAIPNSEYTVTNSGSTLKINGVTTSMNGHKYYCKVTKVYQPSGEWGAVNSDTVSLSVGQGQPVITGQPQDHFSLCPMANISFTTTANGSNLSYQWQQLVSGSWVNLVDNTVYPKYITGTTTPNLEIKSIMGYQEKHYRCMVANTCGMVASDTATVSYAPMVIITKEVNDDTVCTGDSTEFISTSNTALTYQWEVSTGGLFVPVIDSFPYSGVNTSSLKIQKVTGAMNGYRYRCIFNTCVGSGAKPFGTLTVDSCITTGSTALLTSPKNLVVYPNPAHSVLNIRSKLFAVQAGSLKITDRVGKVVYSLPCNQDKDHISVDIDKLPAGLYMLQFTGIDGISASVKFIKE